MFETFSGREYLAMEIACTHDKAYEKMNWTDRLAHFETIDLEDPKSFQMASNPIGMRAAVNAYKDAQAGIPSGTMISLDATSSGLQLLSLLVSCPKSWSLCGGDSDNIQDSYARIYDAMGGVVGNISRKDVKSAVMKALYASVAVPQAVFGDDIDTFYETMEREVPGAWDLNMSLQGLWDTLEGNEYSWVLPDNFHAHIATTDKEEVPFTMAGQDFAIKRVVEKRPDFHKGIGPNLIHSVDAMVVREMVRRCSFNAAKVIHISTSMNSTRIDGPEAEMVQTLWDRYKKSGFLSVRILDYLSESTMGLVDPLVVAKLITTLPDTAFHVVTVHDCFRIHPNNGDDVRRQYNHVLADINDSKILTDMASQVLGRRVRADKVGEIDRQSILDSNYAIA